jgi:hypothetical protein
MRSWKLRTAFPNHACAFPNVAVIGTPALECMDMLEGHLEQWRRAVRHPCLDACKEGTVTEEQFNM